MADVKIVLNYAGLNELRRSDAIFNACKEIGNGVLARCDTEHYEMGDRSYPDRKGVAIYPIDAEGAIDNLKNNTLLKAVR